MCHGQLNVSAWVCLNASCSKGVGSLPQALCPARATIGVKMQSNGQGTSLGTSLISSFANRQAAKTSRRQPMRVAGLRSQSSPLKIREATHVSNKKDSFSGGFFIVHGTSAMVANS